MWVVPGGAVPSPARVCHVPSDGVFCCCTESMPYRPVVTPAAFRQDTPMLMVPRPSAVSSRRTNASNRHCCPSLTGTHLLLRYCVVPFPLICNAPVPPLGCGLI